MENKSRELDLKTTGAFSVKQFSLLEALMETKDAAHVPALNNS
jgi:hypothetical protein